MRPCVARTAPKKRPSVRSSSEAGSGRLPCAHSRRSRPDGRRNPKADPASKPVRLKPRRLARMARRWNAGHGRNINAGPVRSPYSSLGPRTVKRRNVTFVRAAAGHDCQGESLPVSLPLRWQPADRACSWECEPRASGERGAQTCVPRSFRRFHRAHVGLVRSRSTSGGRFSTFAVSRMSRRSSSLTSRPARSGPRFHRPSRRARGVTTSERRERSAVLTSMSFSCSMSTASSVAETVNTCCRSPASLHSRWW